MKPENTGDLRSIKSKHHVPADLQSCHTAVVGRYVVEGHVPAETVRRLLREQPPLLGVAVPGMPVGSPGMETPGEAAQPYEVVGFDRRGRTGVFERR